MLQVMILYQVLSGHLYPQSFLVPESPELILIYRESLVFARPSISSAVSHPHIKASICQNETEAVVGQVGNPVASIPKKAMLQ